MASTPSLAEQISHNLEVHPDQPLRPDDHGIWIRIPTRLVAVDPAPGSSPAAVPAAPPNPPPPVPQPLAAVAVGTGVFRRQGDLREIAYAGTTTTIKDMQGLRAIALLLVRPHTNIPAVEVRASLAGVEQATFAGSTGPMVTGEALAELRRSYEELNEELAEAEDRNDLGRQQKLRGDLAALAQHLRQVTGKDGTPRRQSDAERARVAVTQAVRRALAALKAKHAALHDHLGRCIRSGAVLCYRPDTPMRWQA